MARLGSRFRYRLGPADTNPANAEHSLDYLILPGGGRNSLHCAPLSLGWDRNGVSTCTASSLHSVSLLLCESEMYTPFWALLTPEGTKQDTDSITSFCLNSFAFKCEKKLSSPLSQSDTSGDEQKQSASYPSLPLLVPRCCCWVRVKTLDFTDSLGSGEAGCWSASPGTALSTSLSSPGTALPRGVKFSSPLGHVYV